MKLPTRILAFLLLLWGSAVAARAATAPGFVGIDGWINSPPLTMAGLRGKVVLVDFWAYSCINCVREIPHVEHLYETYKDKGLVVIGVHSPEFDFERNPANVAAAVKRLGITFPVALDSEHATWNAWHNQFWPAEYLIDQHGRLIGRQFGEGGYLRMENAIRLLLGLNMLTGNQPADRDFKPGAGETPELHLGSYDQLGLDDAEDGHNGMHHFPGVGNLPPNRYALTGLWKITDEYAGLIGSHGDIELRFKASKLYMVASASDPVTLEVTIDGKPQPPVTVHGSRLYTLFDGHTDGTHLLKLHVPKKGLRVYSFTFG